MAIGVETIRMLTIKGQSVGMDKVQADLEKTATAHKKLGDTATAAAQSTETSSRRYISAANQIDRLAKQIDPAYRAQQQLARGQSTLDRALQQGEISASRYGQLIAMLQQRYGQLTAANDNLSRSISILPANFDRLGGAVANVAGPLSQLFPMLTGIATAKAGVDALQLAGRYETLGVVLHNVGRNAGYSADDMDRYVSAVQRSGITMSESRSTVIRLTQAQIDLSKAAQLARIAQDAAVIGNVNSSEALDRLVHGVQSAQIEVLRGIGITVNFEQSYAKMAQTLGKTTADLTEAEKTQARLNVVMQAGQGIQGTYAASMDTASKQLSSMSRYAEDMLLQLGQRGLPIYTGAITAASGGLKLLSEHTDLLAYGVSALAIRLAAPTIVGIGGVFLTGARHAGTFLTSLNVLNASLVATQARARALSLVMATLSSPVAWVTAIGTGLAIWATRTSSATDALTAHEKIIWAVKDAYEAAGGEVDKIASKIEGVTKFQAQENLDRLRLEYQKIADSISRAAQNWQLGNNTGAGRESLEEIRRLSRELADGKVNITAFRNELSRIGEADPAIRVLVSGLLDMSDQSVKLGSSIDQASAAVSAFGGTLTTAQEAVLAVNRAMGAGVGAALTYAEALRKVIDHIPEVKAALDAQNKIAGVFANTQSGLSAIQNDLGSGKIDPQQAIKQTADLLDYQIRARDNISGLVKAQEELNRKTAENAVNALPAEQRERAKINQYYDEQIIKARKLAETGATQAQITEQVTRLEQQRGIAIANQQRDADVKAAKASANKKNDDYDTMSRRFEDQTRKLQEQAATYGRASEHVARYRAEQELLTAAERAGRQMTPELLADIRARADGYARAAQQIEDLKKRQQALNDMAQGVGQLGYDMFDGLISGTKTWNDAINDLTKSLIKMVMQAALLGQGPLAGMMGMSPASGQSTGGLFGALFGSLHHDGGWVGAASSHRLVDIGAYANAPRFHSGFRPDEYPAILQRGEYVLSRRDIAMINASKSAMDAPAVAMSAARNDNNPPQLALNIYGAPSEPEVRQNEDGSFDVIFDQAEKRTAARMARGQGPLAQTMQLNRPLRG